MRKVSDLINLPVIDLTSGRQLATIKDVVLNADNDILHGFLCENKLLPLGKVKNFGKDAVIVEIDDLDLILEKYKDPVNPPNFLPGYIIGTPIMTEGGKYLGTIGDILVEDNSGKILGYEVSDGLLKDLVSGRSLLTVPQIITYGEDAVIIKEE
ncbi:MAG: hypothetical protein VR72_11745 [Clostridiaceae bacterium BRH_c20a]|nr:MAG: hypothetical protein VR72_15260 [Clostridiaceae bacterium BRH_c20a]KJS21152.1 MAG: hypothetical protein VR72_11745 [Clostridiaceae bacterium BRH_c20a]